jgi:hypothetical protein
MFIKFKVIKTLIKAEKENMAKMNLIKDVSSLIN